MSKKPLRKYSELTPLGNSQAVFPKSPRQGTLEAFPNPNPGVTVIIVGGEDVDLISASRRDELISRKAALLARKFQFLFPGIKLDVAFSWAGTFGETKDGLAYIGTNRGLPHAYFALGYGGNGITYGLIAAEIIRDDFLGRRNEDAHLFRFER